MPNGKEMVTLNTKIRRDVALNTETRDAALNAETAK